MATIKEVSSLANVSMATVSRVLNGTAPVSEDKRERVMAAIEKLNYRPNAFARSLVTNRSGGIGVVVNELSSPFYTGIIQGIEEVVEAHGMHLVVSSGHAKEILEREAMEFMRQRRCDALILQLEATSDYDVLEWVNQDDIPIIIVGRHIEELSERCIHLDNITGGHLATNYLIGNGHRRIAHITGWMAIKDARDRLEGYRRALEEASIPFDDSLVVEGNFVEEGGHRAMQRLLDRDCDFTAVFSANDQTAAGALQALRSNGLAVPNDISLIGYDDVLLARYLYPALSTVRQPFAEMGQAAARLALTALGCSLSKEVKTRFDPELVERESVAVLRESPVLS